MARELDRLEVWTDLEAANGTRSVVMNDWISAIETKKLDGEEVLRVELRRESESFSSLVERRVIRTVFNDGTFDEWRIAKIRQLRDGSNRLIASLDCEGPKYDLTSTMVKRTEADGTVNPYFELYGLTPADHLGVILGGDAPSYFNVGTLGSTAVLDVVYDWDNPLSAIDTLARAAGLEISITGTSTAYTVDMPLEVGSTASKVFFRYARNTRGVTRTAEIQSSFANRVHPRGGGNQGERPTIGDAAWLVLSVTAGTITLSTVEGVPVIFADQLNDEFAESSTGKLSSISDTSSGGVITLASGHSIAAGERVRFRLNSSGDDLVFLEDPASIVTYGTVQRLVDRPDIPAIDNLVANPLLDDWTTGSFPDNWVKVGSLTVSESTASIFRRYGTGSAHIVATSSGRGLRTDTIQIDPSTDRPNFTAQIALRVVSGTVTLELLDQSSTQDGVYPPIEAEPAITSVQDQWVESLGIGGIDLNEVSSTGVRIRVTAYSTGGADWFLDAASLTQTPSGVDQFYDGRASNDLWLAGIEYLQVNASPRVSFDINVIDLERLHPSVFSDESLVLGGKVQVIDSDLGLDFQTRAIEIVRDLDRPGASSLKLSNRPEDLTGLGVPTFRTRSIRPQDVPRFRRPVITMETNAATTSNITFEIIGRTDGQLLALFHNTHDSTAPAGTFTRAPVSGFKESGFSVTKTVTRPAAGNPAAVFEAHALDIRGSRSASAFGEVPVQAGTVVTPVLVESGKTIETSTGAKSSVLVQDPSGIADVLRFKTKIGGAAFSTAFSLKSASPTDGSTFFQTVATKENHDSAVLWRLGFTELGSTQNYDFMSPGFDRGNVPKAVVTATVHPNGKVDGSWAGDFDLNSVRIIAKSTGNPTNAAIAAAAIVDGRVGTSTGLITLTPTQTGFIGLLGFNTTGAGGTVSSTAFFTTVALGGEPRVFNVDLSVLSTGGVGNAEYTATFQTVGLNSDDRLTVKFFDSGTFRGTKINITPTTTKSTFLDSAPPSTTDQLICTVYAHDGGSAGPVITPTVQSPDTLAFN